MLTLLKIAGGVALLLLGVRYLRKGLDRLFGARLASWMRQVGSRPGLAFFTGIVVAIVAPSSTTISLLAVQTVQAGYMTTRQTLAVMLGANIGLTVLVQIVALHLENYAPIFVFFGFVLFQYTSSARSRGVGQIILALGFFFLAMYVIARSMHDDQVQSNVDLQELISIAEKFPLWIALIATIMTVVLQGATASIGLIIGLGMADGFGMKLAIPVVVGANIGQGLTVLLYGWRHVESRRLGAASVLLKLIVGSAVLLSQPWLVSWLDRVPGSLATRVACLHTAFNIVLAMIGLPLMNSLTFVLERWIPSHTGGPHAFGPKYLNSGPIDSIALAQGQSLREILHMADIVRSMLHDVWTAMKTDDEHLARQVSERDNKVDLLDLQIKRFLTRLVREENDRGDADEQIRQLQYLTELETVGDIVDKNLSELVRKKIRIGATFSTEGEHELDEFYRKVMENLLIADTVFTTRDRNLAGQLVRHKAWLNRFEQELRDRHYARLNAGRTQSLDSSAIHLDLLTHLRRINSCVTHVAYPLLHNPPAMNGPLSAPEIETRAPSVE
jgi:phosphate:Na+ symporter